MCLRGCARTWPVTHPRHTRGAHKNTRAVGMASQRQLGIPDCQCLIVRNLMHDTGGAHNKQISIFILCCHALVHTIIKTCCPSRARPSARTHTHTRARTPSLPSAYKGAPSAFSRSPAVRFQCLSFCVSSFCCSVLQFDAVCLPLSSEQCHRYRLAPRDSRGGGIAKRHGHERDNDN